MSTNLNESILLTAGTIIITDLNNPESELYKELSVAVKQAALEHFKNNASQLFECKEESDPDPEPETMLGNPKFVS